MRLRDEVVGLVKDLKIGLALSDSQMRDETFGSFELFGTEIIQKLGRKLQFRKKSFVFR